MAQQSSWQVILKSKSGDRVALFTEQEILGLAVHHKVNEAGTYALTIDATIDDRCDLFEVDGQVEIWRRLPGYEWYKEFEGFHRSATYAMDASGRETYISSGVGYNDLLARRIIAEYAGSAGANKSGKAETVIKRYVDEQAGPSADAGDRIAGLTIETDSGRGNDVAIVASYRNLLEVCQEIAAIGGGDFAIVGTGDAEWQFRWYDGQLGTDRRSTTVFATGFGNMENPKLETNPARANYVLVAGQGEGSERQWTTVPTVNAPTGIDRRTVFRDARDAPTKAVRLVRGEAELKTGKATTALTFGIIQTERYQYGQHYFLGDLVTARYRNVSYDMKIVGVRITLGLPDSIILEVEDA